MLANFPSPEAAREWLGQAIGEHRRHLDFALRHAHRAVALGPLQGDAYVLLAQLSFLEPAGAPGKSAYIHQAYRVRPYDGAVLFAIGEEAGLANRPDLALEYWKRSFRCGPRHQQRLFEVLAGHLPARAFLESFQPEAEAMSLMVRHYQRPELAGELPDVLAAHAAACQAKARTLAGPEAAVYWTRAASSHQKLNDPAQQLFCLENAVAANSTDFGARLALGNCYLALGEYADAESQLRWCAMRKSDHPRVRGLLEKAVSSASRKPARAPLRPRGSSAATAAARRIAGSLPACRFRRSVRRPRQPGSCSRRQAELLERLGSFSAAGGISASRQELPPVRIQADMLVKQRGSAFNSWSSQRRARIGLRLKYIARRLESKTTFTQAGSEAARGSGSVWRVSPSPRRAVLPAGGSPGRSIRRPVPAHPPAS